MDEPDILMNEKQMQILEELSAIAYAQQNGIELPNADLQEVQGEKNMHYSTQYNSVDFE